jgi:hypothetical protein
MSLTSWLFIFSALGALVNLAKIIGFLKKALALKSTRAGIYVTKSHAIWSAVLASVCLIASIVGWLKLVTGPDEVDSIVNPARFVAAFGSVAPGTCTVDVEPNVIWSHRDRYRLAAGCFVYDGTVDIADAPHLQVTKAYDMTRSTLSMSLDWTDSFQQYLKGARRGEFTYVVFLLPKGVEPGNFSTIRQARAMGARVVLVGSGWVHKQPTPAVGVIGEEQRAR